MASRRTKVIALSITPDVVVEVEKLAPSVGAKTISEACRKMLLLYLRSRGVKIPDKRFERQKPKPFSKEVRARLRKNIARANEVRFARLRVLKTLKEIYPERDIDRELKGKLRKLNDPQAIEAVLQTELSGKSKTHPRKKTPKPRRSK